MRAQCTDLIHDNCPRIDLDSDCTVRFSNKASHYGSARAAVSVLLGRIELGGRARKAGGEDAIMSSSTAELVREDEAPTVARAVDLDSHEMVPPHLRKEFFGATRLQALSEKLVLANLNSPNAAKKHVLADDTPINYDTVWNLKGASAPS